MVGGEEYQNGWEGWLAYRFSMEVGRARGNREYEYRGADVVRARGRNPSDLPRLSVYR